MKHLKIILKSAIGIGLLWYAIQSKMIDFSTLQTELAHPLNFLIAFTFLSVSLIACSFRWQALIRTQPVHHLKLREVLELNMIGSFFNTFMPGAVGGDLIKGWYMAGRQPQKKGPAVMTVLIDRVIGLVVMLLYAALTCVFYRQWFAGHLQLQTLATSLWLFSSLSILFLILFYLPKTGPFLATLIGKIPLPKKLGSLRDAALSYQHHFGTVMFALLLSVVSIFNFTLFWYVQGCKLGLDIPLTQYFFIVPIGLTVSALPFLPGGVGVGQVAFYTLLKWMGYSRPELGSTLCTLIQAYTILFNCIGGIFYLKYQPRLQNMPHES